MGDYLKWEIDRISSVNDYDFFVIYSSFQAMMSPRWNCSKCKKDRRHETYKKIYNCEIPGDEPVVRDDSTNYEFFRCPGAFYHPIINDLLRMHKIYQSGINPFGGAFVDVPNKFVEISNLLENLISQHNKEQESGRK